MFSTIFSYELRHWLARPLYYAYAAVLLVTALGAAAGAAGAFDPPPPEALTGLWANSPLAVAEIGLFFMPLLLLIAPAVAGQCLQRDMDSDTTSLLFSFPITEQGYYWAKLTAGLLLISGLGAALTLGLALGTLLPDVQEPLLGPFRAKAYLGGFVFLLLPNLLLASVLVFVVVLESRSIYAGFVTAIFLILLQQLLAGLAGHPFLGGWTALLDPMGEGALRWQTRFWTTAQQNGMGLPVSGALLTNRLLVLGWAVVVAVIGAWRFRFYREGGGWWKRKKRKLERLEMVSGVLRWEGWGENGLRGLSFGRRMLWGLSSFDFRSILRSPLFGVVLSLGLLLILYQQTQQQVKLRPATWVVLGAPSFLFSGLITLLTFLYAGILTQRDRLRRMDGLVEVSPLPDGVFLLARLLALARMQLSLLLLLMAAGLAVQWAGGYGAIGWRAYLVQLFLLDFSGHLVWAMAALFVYTLVRQFYVGFFLLVLSALGVSALPELGVEPLLFHFNHIPRPVYSELRGFGPELPAALFYRGYWVLAGLLLLLAAWLFRRRGFASPFREMAGQVISRAGSRTGMFGLLLLLLFFGAGSWIYQEEVVWVKKQGRGAEKEAVMGFYEKRFRPLENLPQPHIHALKLRLDFFPTQGRFSASGEMRLVNRQAMPIDTLLVHTGFDERTDLSFGAPCQLLTQDSSMRLRMYKLQKPLLPGDSLRLFFQLENEKENLFHRSGNLSRRISFLREDILPGFGYRPLEVQDAARRRDLGLSGEPFALPAPEDAPAVRHPYSSRDADWLWGEFILSTAAGQTALAPGELLESRREGERHVFHYRTKAPIKKSLGFLSGDFALRRDTLAGQLLEVWHHPGHEQNVEDILAGVGAALEYGQAAFGPLPKRPYRIVEFPRTFGTFATVFGNMLPFSEVYFLTDTRQGINWPFYVAAHETAHLWWGHELQPAAALGAWLMTESPAEYLALQVLMDKEGPEQGVRLLKLNRELYRRGQSGREEAALLQARREQEYLTYRKGALALYVLSVILGEEDWNLVLGDFWKKHQKRPGNYPTSLDFYRHLQASTPDSLRRPLRDLLGKPGFSDIYWQKILSYHDEAAH